MGSLKENPAVSRIGTSSLDSWLCFRFGVDNGDESIAGAAQLHCFQWHRVHEIDELSIGALCRWRLQSEFDKELNNFLWCCLGAEVDAEVGKRCAPSSFKGPRQVTAITNDRHLQAIGNLESALLTAKLRRPAGCKIKYPLVRACPVDSVFVGPPDTLGPTGSNARIHAFFGYCVILRFATRGVLCSRFGVP